MNDLIEIVEDLETLETWAGLPGFEITMEDIMAKWLERRAEAEAFMEKQLEMELL